MTEKTDPKHNLMLHSRAKVEFYKNYLERYLRILCLSKYINNVNIYDVFCGMGIYEDGEKEVLSLLLKQSIPSSLNGIVRQMLRLL